MGLLCAYTYAEAQDHTVSGSITDSDSKSGLPGVNVILKGTTIGTTTNAEGKFQLKVPNSTGSLVISFIGYVAEEVPINNRSTIDITLVQDIASLNEVVVTAFGIEREKKALGYTVQEVKGADLVEARSSNVVNGLSGKIAGVRISPNAGPGSGSTVQIRGQSSIGGYNQPLIVVDGVPLEQLPQSFNKQFGGGLSEISPDNIKEMSVLKGPSATALYGSRGQNGVILVTTKNGSDTKGIGIEVNSNLTFERPLVKPKFQNVYGGGNGYRTWYTDGWSGAITSPEEMAQYRAAYPQSYWPLSGTEGTDESWGAPLDGRLVRQWWTGTEVAPLTPQPNNWDEYWQTGKTFTNNVALSGGNDKGSFRLSVGRMDQKGIMYKNDFYRNNLKFNSNYNFTPKLNATISAEYIKSGSDNRGYTEGQQFIWSHRHISWEQLRNWEDYTDVHIQRALAGKPADTDPPNWQHTFFTNPFFTQDRLPLSNIKDRIVGNVAINYKITPYLNAMLRSGTDFWADTRINVLNFERVRNGNRTPGQYSEEVFRSQETNTDLILTFSKELGTDFSLTAMAGGLLRTNYYKRNFTQVGQLVVDGIYNLSNSVPSLNTVQSMILQRESQSVFGSMQLGFRNALFLDVTGRNDWSSTLPAANRSYFYPSVALSAVVTELLNVQSNVLSFGKVRASWASVGNDTDPYSLQQVFTSAGSWNGSIPQYTENKIIANSTLKPEKTNGIELGMDVRFFGNRLGLDVTYYNQATENQILRVGISKASGYDQRTLNAGKIINKGVEIVLNGTPVKLSSGFTWDVTVNFARNRNKVIELAEGLTTYPLAERRGLYSLASVGQPYGALFGIGFEKTPDGQLIYKDGLPVVSTTSRVLGNIQPDWTGGLMNTFSFKGISLSALIDVRMGGDVYDEGTSNARWTGQYEETAVGREEGVIGKGVKNIGTADNPQYVPNDIVVAANTFYGYNNPRRFHEAAIFDASYVKLREVSIGYQIPTAWLNRLFIQNAKISIVGRNLAILFKNHPHLDPEFDRFGGNQQGFGYGELPTTRSMGFNVSLGF